MFSASLFILEIPPRNAIEGYTRSRDNTRLEGREKGGRGEGGERESRFSFSRLFIFSKKSRIRFIKLHEISVFSQIQRRNDSVDEFTCPVGRQPLISHRLLPGANYRETANRKTDLLIVMREIRKGPTSASLKSRCFVHRYLRTVTLWRTTS